MTEFSNQFASLINRERMAAQGDAARTADLIERQVHCLAMTLALCVPASKISEVLAGVEVQLHEAVADAAPIAVFLSKERPNHE